MFLAWALCTILIFFTIKSQVQNLWGKIGLALIPISALGMSMASVSPVDHSLHELAFVLGIPTFLKRS